ncbi:hypothetical protein FCL47_00155 [Desulfopila sp. IMCC35006]|uniref:hypothetical protein n=1 Tax=Desulfopila sp. IMCC35006 TaxID=2569542 RepID=UPI0010ACB8F3|nr:hypothetical protein [Desulfopila sp. IMCC35006]TKB27944.1 hypothetical protein FCL47_00155 [Desulfopila sp. IMCC35006]
MLQFMPNCLPLLIGSLPLKDHSEATELIFDFTPQIPLWPQLPVYKEEGMILQFIPGLPGIREANGKTYIDTESESFATELLAFYEEFLLVSEGQTSLDGSRFQISREVARGFYTFLAEAEKRKEQLIGMKGQTTGPITFCTGLVDQAGRAIFYNDELRDAAVKHLALKARWQTRKMAEIGGRPIMFFDEPGLAGLGSSAFITITNEDIISSFHEVFAAVRAENGLTGVHVCANTEWPVLFDSGVDIISYDAYSYFDKLILYSKQLADFFARGGILATGIVPTTPEFIDIEEVDSLVEKWFEQSRRLQAIGIDEKVVYRQTLITPSCGTGTVSEQQARKVLALTKGVSEKIRAFYG